MRTYGLFTPHRDTTNNLKVGGVSDLDLEPVAWALADKITPFPQSWLISTTNIAYGPFQPLMNVGVVGLQEPRISVTLYTSETYLLSATQTPTQRSDRSYVRNAPPLWTHEKLGFWAEKWVWILGSWRTQYGDRILYKRIEHLSTRPRPCFFSFTSPDGIFGKHNGIFRRDSLFLALEGLTTAKVMGKHQVWAFYPWRSSLYDIYFFHICERVHLGFLGSEWGPPLYRSAFYMTLREKRVGALSVVRNTYMSKHDLP